MPEDEEKKETSEAGEKAKAGAEERSSLRDTHTGLTKQFGKPLVDKTKESMASKVEEIQSQYQQLREYKQLAVSGVSGAFGDLLTSSEKKKTDDDQNSLDDLFGDSSKNEKKESSD